MRNGEQRVRMRIDRTSYGVEVRMAESPFGLLSRIKQPEYTGENRCLPCTAINIGIAATVSAIVAVIALPLGIGLFAVAMSVIGLRGYLIPGTPALTAKYLPDPVYRLFGHENSVTAEPIDLDIETTLKSVGVVTECREIDDLCLTDQYGNTLDDEIRKLRSEPNQIERLSALLSVPAEEITFDDTDHGWFVHIEDTQAGGWDSKAAFLGDLANQTLLSDRLGDWNELLPRDRTRLLAALRSFIEECPDCGGDVVPDEDVVRSCCRENLVSVTTACVDCGATVFKGTGN